MSRATIVLCSLLILVSESANASDVIMRIQLDKTAYKVGEKIKLHISYENASKRPIRFLPESELYHADVLSFSDVSGKKAGKVIPFGEMSVDFIGMSKRVILLQPGQSCSREFDLQVASSLPASYGDKKKGLFLWFPGSNIQLPHPGQYYVSGKYFCSPDHPVRPYLSGIPDLWAGQAKSRPVLVEFD